MRSIVNNERQCLICKTPYGLVKHNIYYGKELGQRGKEEYGCWCYLCARHHNMSNAGVHFNTELDRKLKQYTQTRFNEEYPELNFLQIFGKNYL